MNKKILLLVCLLGIGQHVAIVAHIKTPVTIIRARLGASPYTIQLIDLRPHIAALFNKNGIASACKKPFAAGVYSDISAADGQLHIFNLDTCFRDGYEVFRLNTLDVGPVLALFDARPVDDDDEFVGLSLLFGQQDTHTRVRVNVYDKRVTETLAHLQNINEKCNWQLVLEDVPAQEYKSSLTGRITHVDGYVQPRIASHKRANVFDMFSRKVDQYLHKGIGEMIVHENKKHPELGKEEHFQISLFGILSGVDGDGKKYELPGFFQYTFSTDGVCYHRAFKPWTVYHLRSISNSKTQAILRLAALSYLNELDQTAETLVYKNMLLEAGWLSSDHKNWSFADRIVTDRCYALGVQIANSNS